MMDWSHFDEIAYTAAKAEGKLPAVAQGFEIEAAARGFEVTRAMLGRDEARFVGFRRHEAGEKWTFDLTLSLLMDAELAPRAAENVEREYEQAVAELGNSQG